MPTPKVQRTIKKTSKKRPKRKKGQTSTGVFAWLGVFAVVGTIVAVALVQTNLRSQNDSAILPSYQPGEGAEPDTHDLLPDVADLTELFPIESPGPDLSPGPETTPRPETSPSQNTPAPSVITPERSPGGAVQENAISPRPSPLRSPKPSQKPAVVYVRPKPTSTPLIPPYKTKFVYMVVDDTGNNIEHLKEYLRFPGKLTFAVLPGLRHTKDSSELILKAGQGLILHQPMEALNGQDPGPGVIRASMANTDVVHAFDGNLDQLGTPEGANNHMGSLGTTQRDLLTPVMESLKRRGLFFLDSRTTKDSVAVEVAKEFGVPVVSRDVFLDNQSDLVSIKESLNTALEIARRRGYVVMIGHEWSPQLAVLLNGEYDRLAAEGYRFEKLSMYFKEIQ